MVVVCRSCSMIQSLREILCFAPEKGEKKKVLRQIVVFVSAVLSVTQYNSKSRIRARSNIQIFTELMTASIVYRSKSIMYSIHSTLMLYITGVASSHITLMHAMAFVVLGLSGPVVAKMLHKQSLLPCTRPLHSILV